MLQLQPLYIIYKYTAAVGFSLSLGPGLGCQSLTLGLRGGGGGQCLTAANDLSIFNSL